MTECGFHKKWLRQVMSYWQVPQVYWFLTKDRRGRS